MTKSAAATPAWWTGVYAALVLAAVAAVGHLAGLGALWGVGVGAVAALCAVLAEAGRDGGAAPHRITVQLARCAGVAVWLGWAWTTPDSGLARFAAGLGVELVGMPLHPAALAVLLGGCMIGAHARTLGERPAREPGTGLVLRSAAEWEQRIIRVGGTRFTGVAVQVSNWPNGYGKRVRVTLPGGGVTADDLRTLTSGLAADADLPHGCGIDVSEPDDAGRRTVDLQVSTSSALDQAVDYPSSYAPRSIHDDVRIGEHADATIAGAPIREETWLVVGKRGSGKTTLLHAMTAEIGLCTDALVWHIDLNGGSLSQPWMEPWINGQIDRSPVDWAAPEVDEAIRMLQAAVRIAKHRKVAYRALKRRHNVSLLPVSDDLPAVEIILDEGAEALQEAGRGKAAKLASLLEELQRIARDAAVGEVLSVLRGTSDLVPASMKSQTGVAVCLRVNDDKELAQVLDWHSGADPRDLRRQGAGFLRGVSGEIRRFQGSNLLPAQIEEVAAVIARQRPELDAASAKAAGADYASRHERMAELFADGADVAAVAASYAPEDDEDGASGSAAGWADPSEYGAQGAQSARVAIEAPASEAAEQESLVPELLARVTRAAEACGRPRVATTWLISELGLDLSAKALGSLLSAWGAPVGKQRLAGADVRGPATRDLKAAVARIEEGGPVDISPEEGP